MRKWLKLITGGGAVRQQAESKPTNTTRADPGEVANTIEGGISGSNLVQAGTIGGDVVPGQKVTGANALVVGQVVLPAPVVPAMESVSAPRSAGSVPAAGLFVGRSTELARLDAVVGQSRRAVVVAVHGLGGVGKSTLAARFAEVRADQYSFVWWVVADSPTALDAGLAQVSAAVAPETWALPVEERVELGLRWLASHEDWLLVLDNLTGPADVASLLERVRSGTIVITSRRSGGWQGIAETVAVDVLPEDDAIELLTRIVQAEWPDADLTNAKALCAELGWLPIAVEQAAAYLGQTKITPTAYLDLLARYPARMFATTAEGADATRTMARVWHLTLDRLSDTPLAIAILQVLAWWAPESIPRDFLPTTADAPDINDALGRLSAYSMITLTATTIDIHRLVQAVTRTPDPTDPHRAPDDIATARDLATTILANAVRGLDPRLPPDWPSYQAVLPHAQALLEHTTAADDTVPTCHLLAHVGNYLGGQGDTTSAIAHHTRDAHSSNRILGPDHPDTLTSRNNLASAYQTAGQLNRAIPLYEQTLTDRQRILGPDHPDTLTSRNNLASAYRAAGQLKRAIPLYEQTLTDRQRILGPDHPDTLISRNNLAYAYHAAGQLKHAIALLEEALATSERILGVDHPITRLIRDNLATAHQGD
ncbi:NB-ARC domain-containing protein [Actinokineospora globicatena]|uniref:tetratricopeptide repeat protein n=1 Tax=Actinokineospora globicatena TaxID=103729 RepID=UPI0020A263B8|nr:tetratricopeptide repeat protein [Actinokineospora globicatena]MCP2306523.1 NB-ARC domain-containing protein [Actinokineospora globicatena]